MTSQSTLQNIFNDPVGYMHPSYTIETEEFFVSYTEDDNETEDMLASATGDSISTN
jgi:hypothetical protein